MMSDGLDPKRRPRTDDCIMSTMLQPSDSEYFFCFSSLYRKIIMLQPSDSEYFFFLFFTLSQNYYFIYSVQKIILTKYLS